MNETTTEVATTNAVNPTASDIEVTATGPDEMANAQNALIVWARKKLAEQDAEVKEATDAFESAVKHKWSSSALKRMVERATKRRDFYGKIFSALNAGYTIVPNFPVTAFAIRTDRKNPLRMWTTTWSKKHTQESAGLPEGEGEYKNPFPLVEQVTQKPATATTNEIVAYWADSWKDLHFPISMAKPQIIEAATRSMALKIFDDLAILPGYEPGEGTRPPKMDPMILARIFDMSQPKGWYREERKHVTFLIAWHLNTRDI